MFLFLSCSKETETNPCRLLKDHSGLESSARPINSFFKTFPHFLIILRFTEKKKKDINLILNFVDMTIVVFTHETYSSVVFQERENS